MDNVTPITTKKKEVEEIGYLVTSGGREFLGEVIEQNPNTKQTTLADVAMIDWIITQKGRSPMITPIAFMTDQMAVFNDSEIIHFRSLSHNKLDSGLRKNYLDACHRSRMELLGLV